MIIKAFGEVNYILVEAVPLPCLFPTAVLPLTSEAVCGWISCIPVTSGALSCLAIIGEARGLTPNAFCAFCWYSVIGVRLLFREELRESCLRMKIRFRKKGFGKICCAAIKFAVIVHYFLKKNYDIRAYLRAASLHSLQDEGHQCDQKGGFSF